ncbi:MAG: hypothetical protein GVY19_09485 [Bacteroidetes bacterium]|jgi:hypothetical protein|nr:hypothetical protein [Bacteroidota bacterium]
MYLLFSYFKIILNPPFSFQFSHAEVTIIFIVLASLLITHLQRKINTPELLFTQQRKTVYIVFLLIFSTIAKSQSSSPADSINISADTNAVVIIDTLLINDTVVDDSIRMTGDTTHKKIKKKQEVLDDKVEYHARDSIIISVKEDKVYLYGEAKINYTNIELTADFIEFDMSKNEVFATGLPDSAGVIAGTPVFTQGQETFESKEMRYNFDTKRGIISEIVTQEGEGYLHSETTKRHSSGQIHIHDGKYTTCEADHPHFYIALNKAIAIPDDKIISGPAYMVMADIPLPLIIPFGWFPNTANRTSGLLFPTYGFEDRRGYYLRNLGWYFPISDYMDLKLYSDIYSRGSWGIKTQSDYKLRYRFSGNFNIQYYENTRGDKLVPATYSKQNDFSISWSHRQDAKANPNQNFSANVNMESSGYNKNQETSYEKFVENTQSSSINYRRNRLGPFSINTSFQHFQNNTDGQVRATLPDVSLNLREPLYLFKNKQKPTGKWYEQINLNYNSNFRNKVETSDTVFYSTDVFNEMKMGYRHNIPLSTNFQILKLINISPSIGYEGSWSPDIIKRHVEPIYGEDTTYQVVTDTIRKSTYAHAMSTGLSIGITRKIFGMYQSTNPNSKIAAVRHMITPSVSFSTAPDLRQIMPDYYDEYYDPGDSTYKEYSRLQHAIYGTPSGASGKRGTFRFSLKNNVEMKLRAASDTSDELRKVSILDNLNFSSGYNIYRDSMKLDPISITASTSLFKRNLSLNFRSTLDPYAVNEKGNRINTFEFEKSGKPGRITSASLSAGFSLNSSTFAPETEDKEGEGAEQDPVQDAVYDYYQYLYPGLYLPGAYVDFDHSWSFNARYSWSWSKRNKGVSVNQNLNVSGNISVTEKWKVNVNTGFDFNQKKLSHTSLSITRDLHCWQMSIRVIPFGYAKSYNFTLNAKATILQDVKYEKKKDRRYETF